MIMNQKNKILLAGGVVALIVIIGIVAFFFKKSDSPTGGDVQVTDQVVSTEDPSDIVLDFYDAWLEAVKSTSTDPYAAGVASQPILSAGLRAKLEAGKGQTTEIDPVLCLATPPERVISRIVFELDDTMQVLVMAKNATGTLQTLLTLKKQGEGWYIDDIVCSPGEVTPEREFSFDMEGYLLKSVPPPLDPQYWYIVFEENGEQGHYAPLFIDTESMCVSVEGNEAVCSVDTFRDATKVHIYGQMNEIGIEVKRLEFVAEGE